MPLVIDIETDGLNATQIWVAAVHDTETGKTSFATNESYFKHLIKDSNSFIGHNFIQFDMYWLNKLWGTDIKIGQVTDTFILSTLFNPDRKKGHSLEVWGKRLGFPKIDFNDYSCLSKEMVDYCSQDVKLTAKLYKYLMQTEREDFSDKSIRLEHQIKHIISEQERQGFFLDVRKAHMLMAEVKGEADSILVDIRKDILPSPKLIKEIVPKKKADGTLSKVGLSSIPDALDTVGGPFSLIRFREFNLASPQQIVEKMNKFGWKPVEFTPKGQPKITERNLETVSDNAPAAIKSLARWKMLETRGKTVEGWLDAVGEDDRVRGKVMTMGAVTGRMTHSEPNLANIVANYKPYGEVSRACWTVPDLASRCLVGMDAKGLELRMLAHYMKDDRFTEEVVSGDPHTFNQKAAGLATRNQAKTFIYAFLYGAGPAKIGSIVNGTAKDGRELQQQFLSNLPNLARLVNAVQNKARRGYVRGLDGRRIWVRSNHAALNTLLQGGGAIVCKQWAIFLKKVIDKRNLDAILVNTIHDEQQYEASRMDADELCVIADETMQETGRFFDMNLVLNADSKIGNTWAETH